MCTRLLLTVTVHPRVRGEQEAFAWGGDEYDGSSPRARGTDQHGGEDGLPVRFIPACAGNRLKGSITQYHVPVHPRVRGEQTSTGPTSTGPAGSSPRARGTADQVGAVAHIERFIPACAGNSPADGVQRPIRPVHPRVRGEQGAGAADGAHGGGSSPRARGTARRPAIHRARFRFIPACAGNRSPAVPGRRLRPVHPRVRGEQGSKTYQEFLPAGSSPRARGTVFKKVVNF